MSQPDNVREAITAECDAIKELLLAKNAAYGNSALNPVRIFSKAEPEEAIRVRIDDKLSRLARGDKTGEDSELDLIGYIVLLRVKRRIDSKGDPKPEEAPPPLPPGSPETEESVSEAAERLVSEHGRLKSQVDKLQRKLQRDLNFGETIDEAVARTVEELGLWKDLAAARLRALDSIRESIGPDAVGRVDNLAALVAAAKRLRQLATERLEKIKAVRAALSARVEEPVVDAAKRVMAAQRDEMAHEGLRLKELMLVGETLGCRPDESVQGCAARVASTLSKLRCLLVGNSDTTMSTVDADQRLVDDMVEIRKSLEQATKEVESLRAIKSEWRLMCGALGHPRHPAVAIKDLQDEHARLRGYLAEIRKELDTFRGVACHKPRYAECEQCGYWQYSHEPYGPAGLGHCLAKECPHA